MSYQTDALRTKSDSFHTELVDAPTVLAAIAYRLGGSTYLDSIRKTLFYGKELLREISSFFGVRDNTTVTFDKVNIDTVHGILGVDTESAELLEHLSNALQGSDLDKAKVIDECGDVLWYLNLTLVSLGSSIDEAMVLNIKKLTERFPEKFTEEQAINKVN